MEDSDSLGDMELDPPPKLSFDEMRIELLKQPARIAQNKELLKLLYHYCKDSRKHARIIKYLFWPIIMSLVQGAGNNKSTNEVSLYGLRTFNLLLTCEGSLEAVIGVGKASRMTKTNHFSRIITYFRYPQKENNEEFTSEEKREMQEQNVRMLKDFISKNQNPINILLKRMRNNDSLQIMQEVSKAIRNMAQAEEVIHSLQENDELISIFKDKFLEADTISQENMLETVSFSCKFDDYRPRFTNDDQFVEILLSQVPSISLKVTYFTIKICRQLSKDRPSIQKLQGSNLRLTDKLIIAFKWLDQKVAAEKIVLKQPGDQIQKSGDPKPAVDDGQGLPPISRIKTGYVIASDDGNLSLDQKGEIYCLTFREISKCFQYILKCIDWHPSSTKVDSVPETKKGETPNIENAHKSEWLKNHSIETDIIETIVKLGKQTNDPETSLNAATCLAHITEVLHCNPVVASPDAIDFMIDMLKDAKDMKHHRQGCRYFANLSFYKDFRDELIEKDIGTFLLKAIDGELEEDTIKHSAIALANLSSHKDFMKANTKKSNHPQDNMQSTKSKKWKIKPMIHLLDSAQEHKINLIQSACITLCNMASKPQLHQHFIYEPEISTIKNCLSNPIDKHKGNELVRYMIKLVCNLTKNPEMLIPLSKKGFLEELFILLDNEKQKEIFGNVVTAISYLSVLKDCQEKIIKNKIIPRILEPLTQVHEVDQKMIIIALTSMLFNGIDIQREFIKHGGLSKLLFFMQQKDKIFQQLACKCFSLLSENQQNLQEIIDQECINTIIISCLRTKDIDLETLKEITKIFINLILWHKISKDTFETTCCLCDIGLMIDDQDMNILAIFCLNALSENEESHQYIRNSGVSLNINNSQNESILKQEDLTEGQISDQKDAKSLIFDENSPSKFEKSKRNISDGSINYNSSQSIFNRINYLLQQQEVKESSIGNQDRAQGLEKLDKQSLIITLITSFYLNLARNEENIQFLLQLKLFKILNNLMKNMLDNSESTPLCYTNTIFSKLLKNQQSLVYCVEEEGYQLFIKILKGHQSNKHLFLETLDSIKLFLSKREYLKKFSAIPDCFKLDPEYQDLNVSFLQVLAILSFEKENHSKLKTEQFFAKLEEGQIFQQIQSQFDQQYQLVEIKKKRQNDLNEDIPANEISQTRKDPFEKNQDINLRLKVSEVGGGAIGGNFNQSLVLENGVAAQRRNRIRQNNDKNQSEELALAVSIILANLSCDEDFLKILLGVKYWKPVDQNYDANQQQKNKPEDDTKTPGSNFSNTHNIDKAQGIQRTSPNDSTGNQYIYNNYNDQELRVLPQIERITRLFNLLSHDNIYISEQIAILLSNVSNSPYFRHIFVTDRCMKSLLRILNKKNDDQVARVSQLAALIVVLNLTSIHELILGIENLEFMQTLQDIIKDENLPNVNKSIALLAISNIQTVSQKTQINTETKDFAFQVLINWDKISQDGSESDEVVKNLVYASLILFYNLILKKVGTIETINQLVDVVTVHILCFKDDQIINVVLELLTLFTRTKETSDYVFTKQEVINYVFEKLKSNNQETLRLAALTLSRLAARLDENNSFLFIENLKSIGSFNTVVQNINSLNFQDPLQKADDQDGEEDIDNKSLKKKVININPDGEGQIKGQQGRNSQVDCILQYFLNFLENITSFKKIREEINCFEMFDNMVDLYTEDIIVYSKISLISILFNLNFNLAAPKELTKTFLKLLYKTYKDELGDDEKTKRKIVTLVVSASALEINHKAIIKSNFYTQFKRNINYSYASLVDADEEVELFGLVNIVLNQNFMHLIYQDLKKIHKIALKSNKVEFKTKVDLFLECSKFLAKVVSSDSDLNELNESPMRALSTLNLQKQKTDLHDISGSYLDGESPTRNPKDKSDKSEIVECCLKALLFSLIKLIGLLDTNNFTMFKYFLQAILECSNNLKDHLIYLIKVENLIEFLKRVFTQNFTFGIKEFDDQVLNFSLRIIVSEIFFNLKQEKHFFKLQNISEAIELLVKFAQRVISMNIEKKMFLVSNTLRLISQMITQIHGLPDASDMVTKTNSIEFVRDALALSKDLQPCINIDALFCLTNMMNIKTLALSEDMLKPETVNNAMVIYFAYTHQVELDECIITFLFTISKYPEYQQFMKDKSKVLFLLLERQFDQKSESSTDTSRQKIFSLFHNMTENEEVCSKLDAKQFINLTNKMLQQTSQNKYSADHIHELALKSIINMCKNPQTECFEDTNLKEFLGCICRMYPKFKNLSKQYAIRLITILTKNWQQQKIQDFLQEIIEIISQFLENCDSVIELKLIIMNLDKIATSKQLMKSLADQADSCKVLIKNFHHFIAKNMVKKDFHTPIELLFRFCKKLSKQQKTQELLVNEAIHEICLRYISENLSFGKSQKDEQSLKQMLTTIQNIMKMIKNMYDGNLTQEQRQDIYIKVTQREQIITESDQLLNIYKDSENKDELAIIIVNIIICYNSICNKLDSQRVKTWLTTFSERLIASFKADFQQEDQARTWYIEKYVLIIELLVTRNLEKLDMDITNQLLKIFVIEDTTNFTNQTIWYKLLKILAHLQNIQEITQRNRVDSILQFIIIAYQKAPENLCFFYFMKVVLLVVKKCDNNDFYKNSKPYETVILLCIDFLKTNGFKKDDPLILEVLLYIIDMLNFLLKFHLLHEKLNKDEVVAFLIKMLAVHDNVFIVKSLTSILLESAKITAFYKDLLNDDSLNIFLEKMITYQAEPDSLSNMFDCLRIIIQQTKTPIKYLIATSILKITENDNQNLAWQNIHENNIYCLLKVLSYNIRFLNDEDDESDKSILANGQASDDASKQGNLAMKTTTEKVLSIQLVQELQQKALKYSIMAITNILILTNKDLIFYKKLNTLTLLQENCKFEIDPQMNLRLLYLLTISLAKQRILAKREYATKLMLASTYPRNAIVGNETVVNDNQSNIQEDDRQLIKPSQVFGSTNLGGTQGIGQLNQQNKEIQKEATFSLVNFLLENIFKYKSVIVFQDQDQRDISIPKLSIEKLLGAANANDISMHSNMLSPIYSPKAATTPNNIGQHLVSSDNRYNNYQAYKEVPNDPDSTYCNSFFFEDESQELRKIDGIRLSLNLSLRILMQLSIQKKKVACQAIIENKKSQDLFQFFIPYIENQDRRNLKQIKQVVKILQNCAEFVQFHHAILENDSITYLIKLARRAIVDDFSDLDRKYQQQPDYYARKTQQKGGVLSNLQEMGYKICNETQRKIIIPILRIFINMCTTTQFHWHLSQHNAIQLLTTIREKDDDYIADVAKEVCEKVIEHRHSGLDHGSINVTGGGQSISQNAISSSSQYGKTNAKTESFQVEIVKLKDETSWPKMKQIMLNIEKLLLQKIIRLDHVKPEDLQHLLDTLNRVVLNHQSYQSQMSNLGSNSGEDDANSKNRRVILKSLLVVINFIYSKKYLKDVISSFAKQSQESNEIFAKKSSAKNVKCALEENQGLKLIKDVLFPMLEEARKLPYNARKYYGSSQEKDSKASMQVGGNVGVGYTTQGAMSQDGFFSFIDFRDISEEVIYLFCSLSMSPHFTTEQLCSQILPIGEQAMNHAIVSLQRASEQAGQFSDLNLNDPMQVYSSISTICSVQCINAALESLVVLLRNTERNQNIIQNFDLTQLFMQLIQILNLFESKTKNDQILRGQFENSIATISINIEIITKLTFFSGLQLMPSAVILIKSMLDYQRTRKTAFFALYCMVLQIQDYKEQPQCIQNIIPCFTDPEILKQIFNAIKEIDNKFNDYKTAEAKALESAIGSKLDSNAINKYESQTKAQLVSGNNLIRQEFEQKKEFEEAIIIRKSCLQILVIIVEFLSNAIIKNEQVILEGKPKESNPNELSPDKKEFQSRIGSPQKNIPQVILTNITAYQHQKITHMIYTEQNFLDLIYTTILMRIPENAYGIGFEPMFHENKIQHQERRQTETSPIFKRRTSAHKENYQPSSEEIKLATRGLAAMPFSVLQKINPMVNLDCQFFENKFTVSGYFKALAKVIENGYGVNTQSQIEIPETGNSDLTNQLREKIQYCRATSRQAVYFALYAALDFMIRIPLEAQPVLQKQLDDQDQQLQLNNIKYGQIISCLINTGLLNRIIQLPQQVDIHNPDDEQLVRLSMKLLITTIFKGQQISGRLMINFDQKSSDSQFFVPKLTSIFEDTGIKDPDQIKQIMLQMSTMIQKVHNFEIAQIYDETYVQYLHLLSQITINTIETGTSSINEGLEDSFLSNSAFLANVIKFYQKKCSSDNQLQKLMKSDDTAKRIIIYQFFFINYLLSICTSDTIKYASKLDKNEDGEISLAQSMFIILIEILNALSDSDNNAVVDKIIGGRIETFTKVKKEITEQRNILSQISQQIENETLGKEHQNAVKTSPSNNKQSSQSSVTMTITKMLLFNLERLLQVVIEVQAHHKASSNCHHMQIILISEDELQILVQLLIKNEQHGEIVTRIYDILSGFLEASKSYESAYKNIAIIDMSKSLLQICIKHSSIYQCEPAFLFLSKLVQVSDKYVNKQDVQFSLTKIMPASLARGDSVTNRSKIN